MVRTSRKTKAVIEAMADQVDMTGEIAGADGVAVAASAAESSFRSTS